MQLFPTNFPAHYSVEGHVVEYRDLREMAQGGPEVGKLFVDGHVVGKDYEFGGPLIEHHGSVLLPIYRSGYFYLTQVDLDERVAKVIGPAERLVLVASVFDGAVRYYNDLANTNVRTVELS